MATISSGWQVKLTGWPWWAVLLLAVAGVWALVRLHRKEMSALAPRVRQRLLWLRGAALALFIFVPDGTLFDAKDHGASPAAGGGRH